MGFITVAVLISWLCLRYGLDHWGKVVSKHLHISRSFEVENCYVGDVLDLKVVTENTSRIPMSFISLDMAMPEGVNFGQAAEQPRVRLLTHLGALQRWEQDHSITFNKRGYYLFSNTNYQAADYYGVIQHQGQLRDCLEMHVYPQLRPLSDLLIETRLYNGIMEQRRWMMEDPLLVVGSRDYSVTDPMKYVHWSATAKTNKLQSKKMAFTTESAAMIILNVQLTDQYWNGWNGQILELMVETAAAICHDYESAGHKYGVASNCPITEGSGGVLSLPASGRKHYHHVFRILSKLNGYASSGLDALMGHVCKQISIQTRLIIITAFLPKAHQAMILKLMALGYQVKLIVPEALAQDLGQNLSSFSVHVMKEVPDGAL